MLLRKLSLHSAAKAHDTIVARIRIPPQSARCPTLPGEWALGGAGDEGADAVLAGGCEVVEHQSVAPAAVRELGRPGHACRFGQRRLAVGKRQLQLTLRADL